MVLPPLPLLSCMFAFLLAIVSVLRALRVSIHLQVINWKGVRYVLYRFIFVTCALHFSCFVLCVCGNSACRAQTDSVIELTSDDDVYKYAMRITTMQHCFVGRKLHTNDGEMVLRVECLHVFAMCHSNGPSSDKLNDVRAQNHSRMHTLKQ